MTGQVLHVLQRHVLGEQICHDQDAEAVGTEDRGEAGILQPPLEHEAHGVGRQGPGGELLLFPQGGPEQGRLLEVLSDPGRLEILPKPAVEVVTDGDLPLLAALFAEPEDPLGPLVLEVPSPQTGDGTDPGPGVGEGPQKGPIAQADDMDVSIEPSRSRAWGDLIPEKRSTSRVSFQVNGGLSFKKILTFHLDQDFDSFQ